MIYIKLCPKNWRYCNLKSLATSANNHSSACYSWKNTAETNTDNFYPENKLTTDDHDRTTMKTP